MKKKNNYKYLKAVPKIHGVNSIFNIGFIEKRTGRKDAQKNQICQLDKGHITPYIDYKVRLYNSYIDKVYLKTALNLAPVVQEANALTVELNLMLAKKAITIEGNDEESQRQAALQAVNCVERERRKEDILTRIAEIKAESDMVDESLKYHIERAEEILHSHISRYWRGILMASADVQEYFPYIEKNESVGRKVYLENRKKLIVMIESVIEKGGGLYEAYENYEEAFCG